MRLLLPVAIACLAATYVSSKRLKATTTKSLTTANLDEPHEIFRERAGIASSIRSEETFDGELEAVVRKLQDAERLSVVEIYAQFFIMTLLEAYFNAAGITQQLSAATAPITVLMPWNFGWERLNSRLTTNFRTRTGFWIAHLQNLCRYHIADSEVTKDSLLDMLPLNVTMQNGEEIVITSRPGSSTSSAPFRMNGINTLAYYQATNGQVYFLNDVLLPVWVGRTLFDLVTIVPDTYSAFANLVTSAGLESHLRNPTGSLTIFAPHNDAINSLPQDARDYLLSPQGRRTLQDLLRYHMVPEGPYPFVRLGSQSLPTLLEGASVQLSPGRVDEAAIVTVDQLANNGLIHVIDKVLSIGPIPPVESPGDIRLTDIRDATDTIRGIVEIFNENAWGRVCDDSFDVFDASVACRQLGFPPIDAILHPFIINTPATTPIWMDELQCTGTETRLVDCPFPGFDAINCSGNRVVEVSCRKIDPNPPPSQGDIRLVNTQQGVGEIRGRPEVFIDGFWVRVCDDNFDVFDAGVACRQLGYSSIDAKLHPFIENDYTTGAIGMDELTCVGNEVRLVDCPFLGLGQQACGGNDFVEITCKESDPDPIPSQGDIRLANIQEGVFDIQGRVEVFHDGFWVRVCDDGFDIFDAAVACRQLNYSSIDPTFRPFIENDYTTGAIGMDELACNGDESRLEDCPFLGGAVTCGGNDVVEITCQRNDPIPLPSQNDIRLANMRQDIGEVTGRVEVFNEGLWVRVCDDRFDELDAAVACRQLGFSAMGAVFHPNIENNFRTGVIWMDEMQCTGDEPRLVDCPFPGFGVVSCGGNDAIEITCQL